MKNILLASAVLFSAHFANAKTLDLLCKNREHLAQISFDAEIIHMACRNEAHPHPAISYSLNLGDAVTWSPVRTVLLCSEPLQKTMMNFYRSPEESIYLEVEHGLKRATASLKVQGQHYNMECISTL
ncbi:hypothetical protein ACLWBD_03955 [Bdellovibrio sp. HCB117]|uniref:hypothetical protein n=1 Tax=Bdellovibrio sp. HCB117 TaxID=3394359 RepID=UPI0039B47287